MSGWARQMEYTPIRNYVIDLTKWTNIWIFAQNFNCNLRFIQFKRVKKSLNFQNITYRANFESSREISFLYDLQSDSLERVKGRLLRFKTTMQ